MRKQLAAFIVAGATIAGLGIAPDAHAAPGDTATSFTLTGGALSVSVPGAATLTGTATAVGGVTASGQLGATTVTDARGALVATWTASVDGTDFTTGGGTDPERVLDDDVDYSSGLATATTGVVVATPGLPLDMSATRTAMAGAGVGNNTVTWNPTLTVNVPAGNVAGTYTGTITHSVA